MKINSLILDKTNTKTTLRKDFYPFYPSQSADSFEFSANNNIDEDVLIRRKIISPSTEINEHFKFISADIFKNNPLKAISFYKMLANGYIGLSSSIIKNIHNPNSAVGIELNPKWSDAKILSTLHNPIIQEKGVGINFSKFKDPVDKIKKINSYFKLMEKKLNRPPAGIALLSINHPKILDFISLKNNEDYKNWCFDLSVIIPDDFLNKVDRNEDISLNDGKKINSRVIYGTLLNSMNKKGEPGIIFSNNPDYICDPCGACQLKNGEKFTISHINLAKFYDKKSSSVNYNALQETALLISDAIKRINSKGCIGVLGYNDLIKQMNFEYGKEPALKTLSNCLNILQKEANKKGLRTAISPTGTVSKYLSVTPSIQPDCYSNITYYNQLDTIAEAQKYIDCNISNTIILKENENIYDTDSVIRYAKNKGIKGLTVFKPQHCYL